MTRQLIRKDIYNARRVWFNAFLACFYLCLFFKSFNAFFVVLGAIGTWRALQRMNLQTIKALMIDRGNFTINKVKMNLKDGVAIENEKETIQLDTKNCSKFKEGEEFYLITVANNPCFAYAVNEYDIEEELLPFIKI